MRINLNYKVFGYDRLTYTFTSETDAIRFFESCVELVKQTREHCNVVIKDRWPIIERSMTAYNGEFSEYKSIALRTYCFKNPDGKNMAL